MDQAASTNTLRDYLSVIRQRWALIAAITLIATAAAIAFTLLRPTVYSATSTIQFRSAGDDIGVLTPGVQLGIDTTPDKSAAANSRTVTSDAVIRKVQKDSPSGTGATDLRDNVSVSVQPDSNLIAIEVSDPNAERAARLANSFAQGTQAVAAQQDRAGYADQADRLHQALRGGGLDPAVEAKYRSAIATLETLSRVADPVRITEPATTPASPSSPKPARDVSFAVVLGLMLGIAAAFVSNALDRRVRDSGEVQRALGYPLVGYVRDNSLGVAGVGQNGSTGDRFTGQDELEAFRIIRTNVQFLAPDKDVKSIVVTSALPEEGKSTVAAWYAHANATAGRRTLLVDCDLRRPVLAERLGLDASPGLTEYLVGDAESAQVLRSLPVQGHEAADTLAVIPAGASIYDPTELIGSDRFRRFVDSVGKAYDVVVFDSAPLLPVGDTLELIPRVDAVMLCVRLGQTTRDQAHRTKEVIDRLPTRPTGIVVTGVKPGGEDDYYGYYSTKSLADRPS